MSKGSKVIPIRFPDLLLKAIGEELASRKDARAMRPINFSEWVRQACSEKIAHAKRSRKASRKSQDSPQDLDEDLEAKGCFPV